MAQAHSISQTVTLPTGYVNGTAWLRGWIKGPTSSTCDLKLEALSSGDSVLDTESIDNYQTADASTYYLLEIFMELPASTAKLRVTFYQDSGIIIDCFRVHVFKELWPVEEHVLDFGGTNDFPAMTFPATTAEWEAFGADVPIAIWLFEDDGTSGEFLDELSDAGSSTYLGLNIVSDTNHKYEQSIAAFYDLSLGHGTKTGLETKDGINVGADFPNTGDASFDGENDFSLLGSFSALRNASDRYLAGSGTTVGWNLKLKSTGVLELYVGSSGDNDTITLTKDYRDGALHYFVVWYDHTAGTFRLWTDLESPSAISMPTGDCANAAYVRLGGVATQTSPASQWAYAALWRTKTLTPTMTDAWWLHNTDPTGYVNTHNLNTPITVPIGSDTDGELLATYSPGQVPITHHTDENFNGLLLYEGQTNLLADTDPNSSNWVEEGSPTVTKQYDIDARRWKRSVQITSDNSDAYRPPAITQGSGDITVVWYAKVAVADEYARLTLVQTDAGNPINHDYKVDVADEGKWKRFEHTFAWAGGTAAFELWFHGSADASEETIEISDPILIVAGDEVQYAATHSTTALSAIQCEILGSSLPTALVTEGEMKIEGTMKYDVGPGSEQTIVNLYRSGSNNDRRIVLRDASDDCDFRHYDASATLSTGTITSPANWDQEWALRVRWNYGGLLDDRTVFAEIDGFSTDDDARSSTFTSNSGAYTGLQLGSAAGSTPCNGVLKKITISSRERTK